MARAMTLETLTLPDIIGLIGVGLILAILILISLYYDFNLPSFIIEIAWLIISGYGLWKAWRRA